MLFKKRNSPMKENATVGERVQTELKRFGIHYQMDDEDRSILFRFQSMDFRLALKNMHDVFRLETQFEVQKEERRAIVGLANAINCKCRMVKMRVSDGGLIISLESFVNHATDMQALLISSINVIGEVYADSIEEWMKMMTEASQQKENGSRQLTSGEEEASQAPSIGFLSSRYSSKPTNIKE